MADAAQPSMLLGPATLTTPGTVTMGLTALPNGKSEWNQLVPKDDAKRLIGPRGANIQRMRDQSRCFIKVDNTPIQGGPDNEMCQLLHLNGTNDAVPRALEMIRELLAMPPEMTVGHAHRDYQAGRPQTTTSVPSGMSPVPAPGTEAGYMQMGQSLPPGYTPVPYGAVYADSAVYADPATASQLQAAQLATLPSSANLKLEQK